MKQPVLSVKRKVWRQDDEHTILHDEKYKAVREKILMRDKYTCSHCGFKFNYYQEVHHIDDDHSNQDESNLETICGLCHQVYHLGMTALRGSGFIAYIPELKQTDINSLCRVIFMQLRKMDDISPYINKLQGLYSIFQERGGDTLKKVFYHGDKNKLDISQPMVFAQYLSLCSDDDFNKKDRILSGFVLVPTINAFKSKQLEEYFIALGSENNKIDNYFDIYNSLISNGKNL
ncbi:type IVB secretion system protein IcmJDotN [Acerihabitans sp. TG2]|uniref:type IVB secretion system protein IcmJDotN n=1 Tax=Acerihabitans sp. TG2 TaxID=3096008 RepID=UPI002B234D11|nr:type IVB secretion system protein IcmJDotN [Acerihabitans sp. TG2]MEA9392218.1 type IVB secretion system protein IcmJDotN [Acerihabitans sp. TG2]